jgi:hypothetical protein
LTAALQHCKANQKAVLRYDMSSEHDNKITTTKEIASLIDALKSEADRAGNAALFSKIALEQLLEKTEALHKKLIICSYLASLPEEKIIEKPAAEIIPPVIIPEPVIPQPEIIIPEVQVPVAPAPVVPVEPKPEPKKETPVVPPAKKHFPDIKTMIGFNERLMFLSHLFAKDALAYETAISQINNCNSLEEAQSFLSVLSTEYKWNPESEPVFIFNSIVKRRFA